MLHVTACGLCRTEEVSVFSLFSSLLLSLKKVLGYNMGCTPGPSLSLEEEFE